jgi:transposase
MERIRVSLTSAQRAEVRSMMDKTRSRVEAMRCRIVLLLDAGDAVLEVERKVGCARATVYRTAYRVEDAGLEGLLDARHYRPAPKATPAIRVQLTDYLDAAPTDFGWRRPTWTRELLALQLEHDTGVVLSPAYVGQLLRQEKCRRGRPRPALRIPVRGRRRILEQIQALVERASAEEEVFYVDEADIDLNPRIGSTYMKRGRQWQVFTPGTNVKYYVAGALNVRTGTVLYSHGPRKNSELFTSLLDVLSRGYRRARIIHLILDNYNIHKSAHTHRALAELGDRIQLHFLPPYSPEHNKIERLWKQLHDNVTRNHRHSTMTSLWQDVVSFLQAVQPFPGTQVSTLRRAA